MPKDYEDEIRDILNRMDTFLPNEGKQTEAGRRRPARGRPAPRRQAAADGSWRGFISQFQREPLTPFKVMGGSMLLILFSWLFSMFNGGIAQLLSLIAVVMFIVGLIWSIRSGGGLRGTGPSSSQYWRGQEIRLPPHRAWWENWRQRKPWSRWFGPRRPPPSDSRRW
jgi:hypothetical protein